jgi:hypothetical protein
MDVPIKRPKPHIVAAQIKEQAMKPWVVHGCPAWSRDLSTPVTQRGGRTVARALPKDSTNGVRTLACAGGGGGAMFGSKWDNSPCIPASRFAIGFGLRHIRPRTNRTIEAKTNRRASRSMN